MKVKDAVIIKWILLSAHLPCFLMPLSAKVHCLNKNETDLAHCNMDACQPIIFKYNFGINVAERVSYRKVSYFWNGRLKIHDLKMQDWKMTDNFARNRRVWKMQDWKWRTMVISAYVFTNFFNWRYTRWLLNSNIMMCTRMLLAKCTLVITLSEP